MRAFAAMTLYVSLSLSSPALFAQAVTGQAGAGAEQWNSAARKYLDSGDYLQAEACLRRALEAADSRQSPSARAIRVALADLLREEGRPREARTLYEAVLRFHDVSTREKYDAMAGLADMDGMNGDTGASAAGWAAAIGLARGLHSTTLEAAALRGLSMTWLEANDTARAEPLLRQSLALLEKDPSSRPWALAATLTSLGLCYVQEDKLGLAEDAYTRALELNRRTFGDAHPQVAFVMERLASVYSRRNSFAEARENSDRAMAIMQTCCGPRSQAMAAALLNRANVERRAGAPEAAAGYYAEALRAAQTGAGDPLLEQQILAAWAPVLKSLHRNVEARRLAELARTFRTAPAR